MFWVIVMLEDPSTTHFQLPGGGKEVVTQDFYLENPQEDQLAKVPLVDTHFVMEMWLLVAHGRSHLNLCGGGDTPYSSGGSFESKL